MSRDDQTVVAVIADLLPLKVDMDCYYCGIFWNIIQILCNLIEYCAILWIMQNIVDNVKYCGYVTAGVCKLPPPMIKAMSWQHHPPPTQPPPG